MKERDGKEIAAAVRVAADALNREIQSAVQRGLHVSVRVEDIASHDLPECPLVVCAVERREVL